MGRITLIAQGVYFLVSGLWPIVSLETFERVTGPKTDDWLVKTVGLLAAVIGGVILDGARRPRIARETRTLAIAAALAFAVIDIVYVANRTIRPVYAADAALEGVFATLLVIDALRSART
jgi:hypothetical protein